MSGEGAFLRHRIGGPTFRVSPSATLGDVATVFERYTASVRSITRYASKPRSRKALFLRRFEPPVLRQQTLYGGPLAVFSPNKRHIVAV